MEEEAERRRQPPLKLEPEEEVIPEKVHRDRDRDRDRERERDRGPWSWTGKERVRKTRGAAASSTPLRSIRTTMWRKGRRRTTTTERTHKKPSRYSNPSCDQSVLLPQCPPPVGTRPLTRPVTNLPAELSFLVRTRPRSSLQRNIGPRSMSVSSWVSAEANVGHKRIYFFSSTALFQNKLTLLPFLFSRGHQQSQPAQRRKEKETGHGGKCFQQVWWRGGRWAASQEETGSTGLWWWRQESGGGRGRVTRGQRQHQHRRETQAHKEPYWEDPHSQTRAVLLPSGLDYGWLGKKLGQFRFQAVLFTCWVK